MGAGDRTKARERHQSVYKGINNIQGPSHLDSFNSVAANELAASEPLSSKNLDVLD
jgi:hypothetical protein